MVPSCDLCAAPAHGIDHYWMLPLLPHLPAPPAWQGGQAAPASLPDLGIS